ncbi:hypothetical protein [Paenibacillus anaericanus]|uniref:hypothetical protein n=1 Tax=Paenibacillus anaericanus TaxID=170367 RepID=UPI0027D8E0AD|nr:hypothetical protein [Paenibacillus anaericanus]
MIEYFVYYVKLMYTIKDADRIVVVNEQEIEERGRHDELVATYIRPKLDYR